MLISEIFVGVGAVADALYVIERVIQAKRSDSAREKAVLEAARSELEPHAGQGRVAQAEDVVNAAIDKTLPQVEARLLRRHLRAASDVTSRFVREARESSAYGRLPNFGAAIEHAAVASVQYLAEWGCFDAWGEPCWLKAWDHQRPTEGPIRLLPAREVTRVGAAIAPRLGHAKWSFVHVGMLAGHGVTLVDVEPLYGKDPPWAVHRTRSFVRDGSNGTFVAVLRECGYRRPRAPRPPNAMERWTIDQMTAYFDAVVSDFLDYALRVRTEIARAEERAASVVPGRDLQE